MLELEVIKTLYTFIFYNSDNQVTELKQNITNRQCSGSLQSIRKW